MRNRFIGGGPKLNQTEMVMWFVAMVVLMVVLGGIFRDANGLVNGIITCGSVLVTYVAVLFVKHRRGRSLR